MFKLIVIGLIVILYHELSGAEINYQHKWGRPAGLMVRLVHGLTYIMLLGGTFISMMILMIVLLGY